MPSHVACAKKNIHPEWFEESRVICNGEEVLVTSGTKPNYTGEISLAHVAHCRRMPW